MVPSPITRALCFLMEVQLRVYPAPIYFRFYWVYIAEFGDEKLNIFLGEKLNL
jgi:hypothetical protein